MCNPVAFNFKLQADWRQVVRMGDQGKLNSLLPRFDMAQERVRQFRSNKRVGTLFVPEFSARKGLWTLNN
jgi:hypothetical protein